MNVGGDTYNSMGFGEAQAIFHQVLESHFKCNQGTVFNLYSGTHM